MKRTYSLIISVSLLSTILTGCGSQAAFTPEPTLIQQAPAQNVNANSNGNERGKIIASMLKKPSRIIKNGGGSYEMTLRFEYNGSIFTPASEDVAEFMQRYGSDLDDWELEELDNDSWDQLGKRRFRLTIYGPDRSRLDYILSNYRDHLRSLG
jgi:hypothetical protein